MMHARKRMGRGGGAWCGELAAHSPEGEGRVKAARRGSSRKKQLSHQAHQNGWSGERQSLVADSSRGNADLCKRVMVVVDASQESKLALKWALSHVVQPMDVLTLLHVQPPPYLRLSYSSHGTDSSPCPRNFPGRKSNRNLRPSFSVFLSLHRSVIVYRSLSGCRTEPASMQIHSPSR